MPAYLLTDRSIKPKHMEVGDLVVGHHEGDPKMKIPTLAAKGHACDPIGPHLVVKILQVARAGESDGVYIEDRKLTKYVGYSPRASLWLIVRDRPGIPRFIADYPNVCPVCGGNTYIGLKEVIHERGRCGG